MWRWVFCGLWFPLLLGAQPTPDVFDLARKGSEEAVRLVLATQPRAFDCVSPAGFTPLILACYKGNTPVVKVLLEAGVAVNYTSDQGTALMAAVVRGNAEVVGLLLNAKADPNLTDVQGNTALHFAVQFKNTMIIKQLLAHGARRDAKDGKGMTAFEYAVQSGDEAIIALLKG